MKMPKKEIALMCIPLVGIWFVLKRIIPDLSPISWWDVYSEKAIPLIIGLVFYQIGCGIGLKYIDLWIIYG